MSSLRDLLQYSDTSGSDEEGDANDSSDKGLVLPRYSNISEPKVNKTDKGCKENNGLAIQTYKRKTPGSSLPLPNSVRGLLGSEDQCPADDIQAHSGRKRSFPHVSGDWPSSVFIKVDVGINLFSITKKIHCHLRSVFPSMEMIQSCDQHLSLSRTVSLRHYWIEPLVSKLGDCFRTYSRFLLVFDGFEMYANDDKTRSFFALKTMNNNEKLLDLVKHIDSIFTSFGLECYYKDPSFHVSFAWDLCDVTQGYRSTLQKAKDMIADIDENELPSTLVTEINLKTGNKYHLFKLQNESP